MARGSRTRVTRAPVLVTERGAPPHLLPVLLGVVVVSVVEGEAELLSQCHAHAGLATTCTIIMYILYSRNGPPCVASGLTNCFLFRTYVISTPTSTYSTSPKDEELKLKRIL